MHRKLVAGKTEKPRFVVAKITNVNYNTLKQLNRHDDVCSDFSDLSPFSHVRTRFMAFVEI